MSSGPLIEARPFCVCKMADMKRKMQLDVGSEPYLFTAQALCLVSYIPSITGHLRIGRGLLLWHRVNLLITSIRAIFSHFWSSTEYRQTDRRTESDAYEPTVQLAQAGSKTLKMTKKNKQKNMSFSLIHFYTGTLEFTLCKMKFFKGFFFIQ